MPLAGNNGGDSGRTALIPNFYGVMRALPDISIGIPITAPSGNSSEYDPAWIGRYLGTKTMATSLSIFPRPTRSGGGWTARLRPMCRASAAPPACSPIIMR